MKTTRRTSSTATGKSASGTANGQFTKNSKKKVNGWSARHDKLADKIGFIVSVDGRILTTRSWVFNTSEEATEYVKTSTHWLCQRAVVESARRKLLWTLKK